MWQIAAGPGTRRGLLQNETQRDETESRMEHFFSDRRRKGRYCERRDVMKKLVLASVSALALLGVAACSDSADTTTTQGVPQTDQTQPADPMAPPPAGGTEPAPAEPAPAQ